MSSAGRRWRVPGAVAIASAVVIVLTLLFNQWLGRADLHSGATATSTTAEPTQPADQVPMGVDLTDEGLMRIHVPRCPSAQVTAVDWTYFPNLNTLWSIDRDEDGPAIYEFTVGVAPPGFSTSVEFAGSVDEVPDDIPFSFIAIRSTESGERLPAATASVQLDELSVGSIRYQRSGELPNTVVSADEFQVAVGC